MRWLVAALALVPAGCGESVPPDLATTRTEIEALVRKFHEHMNRGELDAVGAMLAPECSLTWHANEPEYGRESVLRRLQGFIDYHKSRDLLEKRKARFTEIRIRQEGNIAVATYAVSFFEHADKPAADEAFTHVFKRISGKWLLLHDHRAGTK